ncbi:MAG: murein hydrolase activator EnvC family protein [Candidatus Gracilibacteria bacterium]
MKKKFTYLTLSLILFSLFWTDIFSLSFPVHAQGSVTSAQTDPEKEIKDLVNRLNARQSQVLKNWNSKLFYSQTELDNEKNKLDSRVSELTQITADINNYQQKIEGLKKNIVSLTNELALLDSEIELTKLQIRNTQIQIQEKEQDVTENYEKINLTEIAGKEQDRIVTTYVELLYKQNQVYFAPEKNISNDVSYFVTQNGINDILTANKYATILRKSGSDILADLQDVDLLLNIRKKQLTNDQVRLAELQKSFSIAQQTLSQQKESKRLLLERTQGEQKNFEILVEENRKLQEEIQKEVLLQQESIKEIETKLEAFQKNIASSSLSPEEIAERAKILAQLGEGTNGKLGLDWPVPPLRGITAYFHDSSYVNTFGVAHSAIDIPAPQASEIHSPADGYVTKVKDSGLGYSYIMVAHNGGVMTLYGHVSKILVTAGDLVKRGDIIGLSGGTPGTAGAGWMTTGAHLHFEVFQDGKHVDPLGYLDNGVLKK